MATTSTGCSRRWNDPYSSTSNSVAQKIVPRSYYKDSAEVDFYELTLAHGPRGCVFLEQKGKQLECGVHPSKPGVCLGYPFSLSRGKIVQITEKLCPVDWEIDGESERHVSGVIRELQEEWFVYDELVSEWNSGSRLDRSLSAFVAFTVAWVKQLARLVPTP